MKYLILALMLSGCASFEGVKMDEDERKACAVATCSVWTDKELRARVYVLSTWLSGR